MGVGTKVNALRASVVAAGGSTESQPSVAICDYDSLQKILGAARRMPAAGAAAWGAELGRSATAQAIAAGGVLSVAREAAGHGRWAGVCGEVGISTEWARRLISVYDGFGSDESALNFAVDNFLSAKQMSEVARLPADWRGRLFKGEVVAGVSGENIGELGGRQLRLAFDSLREEESAQVKLLRSQAEAAGDVARTAINAYQNERRRRVALETERDVGVVNALPGRVVGCVGRIGAEVDLLERLILSAAEDGEGWSASHGSGNREAAAKVRVLVNSLNARLGRAAAALDNAGAAAEVEGAGARGAGE